MSRSYKKHAWICDRDPFMKNYANRRLRRKSPFDDVFANGNWYRRATCPYDICDFKWQLESSFERYVQQAERDNIRWGIKPQSRKEMRGEWLRLISK